MMKMEMEKAEMINNNSKTIYIYIINFKLSIIR